MRKLAIVGASNFVNRMFEAAGNYQWAREFLKNAVEAKASRVEFGLEWNAVERQRIYRRMISDNGTGMDRDELLRFFSVLGEGAKRIGGIHDNFGVGAKIASLPWNPAGLVVISHKDGQAAMIQIIADPETAEYGLVQFETPSGPTYVVDPTVIEWIDDIDWGRVAPEWTRSHGTCIVLLGSEDHPDTIEGNPDAAESDLKGLSTYLNSRFWDLSGVDVRVTEFRSEKKSGWPTSPEDRDDQRRVINRHVMGAQHYLSGIKHTEGTLAATGSVELADGRALVDWYLWEGQRPAIGSYARRGGYIGIRYRDELFQITTNKAHYRWFGIVESIVQNNLTLIVEPQLYDGTWGIHPDQSRNRLIFSGNGQKGIDLPLVDWGLEFAEHMPEEILDAIQAARGELSGTLADTEYRRRLQDRFGSRWNMSHLYTGTGTEHVRPTEDVSDNVRPDASSSIQAQVPTEEQERGGVVGVNRKPIQVVRMRGTAGGRGSGGERSVPVDVPRFRYARKEDFENPLHLALWNPNDPSGPTVLLNQDSPILQEAIRYHQDQYPDVFAEEVARMVMEVYGEIAVCKIAHSQKLAAKIPEQDLDQLYRSEPALTVALMGLLAEESLIAHRLVRLKRKKVA